MNKILITGASGNWGSGVIEHLLQSAHAEDIVAMVKGWSKAQELIMKGIEVRYGNYSDIPSPDAS